MALGTVGVEVFWVGFGVGLTAGQAGRLEVDVLGAFETDGLEDLGVAVAVASGLVANGVRFALLK